MAIANVAALLRDARDIAVLTGAGISAESGIPTFREALTGLWSSYDPQVLATPQGFRRQPRLVWDWYAERRARVLEAAPNPGHFALAELERRAPRAQTPAAGPPPPARGSCGPRPSRTDLADCPRPSPRIRHDHRPLTSVFIR
jgi:hypothetical protein